MSSLNGSGRPLRHPRGVHRGVGFTLYRRPARTRVYLLTFKVGGRKYDRGTGTALLNEAVRGAETIIDEVLDAPRSEKLIQDLVARYWQDLCDDGRVKPASLCVYRPRLRRFLAFCHSRGRRALSELTPELVAEYRTYLRTELGRAMQTVECETNVISGLVKRGLQLGWIAQDLRPRIERGSRRRGVAPKRRVLKRTEVAAIWRAFRTLPDGREQLRPIRFVLWTGCRSAQARGLRWVDLDLGAGTARLIAQKGDRQARTIPLPRRLWRMLRKTPRDPSGFVFGELSRKQPLGWLRTAAAGAGVGAPRVHDLRHTWISWAVARIGIAPAAEMVGHADWSTTKSYTDLTEALRRELDRVR